MASPNATFTELVATTLRNHPAEFMDNTSKNNALYYAVMKRGKRKLVDGGYELVANVNYPGVSTFQYYSGYETINVGATESLTAAKYDWKQASVTVSASGLELRSNKGAARIADLVESRIEAAMDDFANNLSIGLYSDGTGSGGKQITGLQAQVSDLGTGVVGGIDSSTYTWWQNEVQKAATPIGGGGAITPGATTMASLMNPLYRALVRGTDMPDLIVADNNYFSFYEEGLITQQRFTDGPGSLAGSGFTRLKFKNADVVHDGGDLGGGIPTNRMYFLNTKYLEVRVHREAQLTTLDERQSVNQDAIVIPVIFQGNLVCSGRRFQGVILP